uniref:Astrotactin-1/2 Fn3 domain-containing protein n=1 Tax=Knipowitschia caucasica TaxID=637954 RepID=A0AAV2IQF2_KNICA
MPHCDSPHNCSTSVEHQATEGAGLRGRRELKSLPFISYLWELQRSQLLSDDLVTGVDISCEEKGSCPPGCHLCHHQDLTSRDTSRDTSRETSRGTSRGHSGRGHSGEPFSPSPVLLEVSRVVPLYSLVQDNNTREAFRFVTMSSLWCSGKGDVIDNWCRCDLSAFSKDGLPNCSPLWQPMYRCAEGEESVQRGGVSAEGEESVQRRRSQCRGGGVSAEEEDPVQRRRSQCRGGGVSAEEEESVKRRRSQCSGGGVSAVGEESVQRRRSQCRGGGVSAEEEEPVQRRRSQCRGGGASAEGEESVQRGRSQCRGGGVSAEEEESVQRGRSHLHLSPHLEPSSTMVALEWTDIEPVIGFKISDYVIQHKRVEDPSEPDVYTGERAGVVHLLGLGLSRGRPPAGSGSEPGSSTCWVWV